MEPFKTHADILRALADGHTVQRLSSGGVVKLTPHGLVNVANGFPYTGAFATAATEWHIYEEPNPHPQGSLQWAIEETRRGRSVARPRHVRGAAFKSPADFESTSDHPVGVTVQDMEATDWCVV